jgi:hypothetical protein
VYQSRSLQPLDSILNPFSVCKNQPIFQSHKFFHHLHVIIPISSTNPSILLHQPHDLKCQHPHSRCICRHALPTMVPLNPSIRQLSFIKAPPASLPFPRIACLGIGGSAPIPSNIFSINATGGYCAERAASARLELGGWSLVDGEKLWRGRRGDAMGTWEWEI